MRTWALLLLLTAATWAHGQPTLEIGLLRAFDSRLPSPTSTDVRDILTEANRILRAKLPVKTRIKITDAGEMPLENLFAVVPFERENPIWRYDFELRDRAPAFTAPQAIEERQKSLQRFSLQELGNIMPKVEPQTYDAYRRALEAEYHRKMAWLTSLKLPDGSPLVRLPLPDSQSAMDWTNLLHQQERADIIMTNTLIVWDITHAPPPHSIFHHAKLGGGAIANKHRRALNHQCVLLNVFEEYGGIAGICRTDPAVSRQERNRIIGAVLLAHELGHALFAIPDVYDHGDACLMNSSAHNLDQREAYALLAADLKPCASCQPWLTAATQVSDARRAAASGDAAGAAKLYAQALATTPKKLNRDYASYMADLAAEALPVCEKARDAGAIAACRVHVKR